MCSRVGRVLYSSTGLGISCRWTRELSAGTIAWWQMRAAAAASSGCPRGWMNGCDMALSDLLSPAAFLFFSCRNVDSVCAALETCAWQRQILMSSRETAISVSIYLPSPSSGKWHDSSLHARLNKSQCLGKHICAVFPVFVGPASAEWRHLLRWNLLNQC